MLYVDIKEPKDFFKKLLKDDIFDKFLVHGVEVLSFMQFEITRDTVGNNCTWGVLRPYVFNIIKGANLPRLINISLMFDEPQSLHNNAKALFLNIYFENNVGHITTGVSQKIFDLDKSLEHMWEDYIKQFLNNNKIDMIV